MIIALLLIIAMFALMLSLASCSPKVVPGMSHNRDSVRVEKIYIVDSTYIDRWHTILQKGDTVYKHDSIVKHLWRYKEIHDTLTVVSVDTTIIREEIEKPLSKGNKFLLHSGVALWILVAVLIIAGVVSIVLHVRKR